MPFDPQRHQDLLEARKSLIRELSEKHEIPGYDHGLSDHEMQNFEEQVESSIVAQQRKLDRIKVRDLAIQDLRFLTDTSMFGAERGPCRREQAPGPHLRAQEQSRGRRADEGQHRRTDRASRGPVARTRFALTHAHAQRAATSRIAGISRQLEATSASVADIKLCESMLQEDRDRRAQLEEKVNNSDYLGQLRVKAREAKELEEERDELHAELAGLNSQANTRATLQLRRNEKRRKEEAMNSLVDRHTATFRRLLKSEPRPESMEAEVAAMIE